MAPIDLERLRLQDWPSALAPVAQSAMPPRPRSGEKYLRGPIPLAWLATAARLPGKSLHVAIALWFMAGLTRSRIVSLGNVNGLRFGLDRNAKYRALDWLEEARLIAVDRKLGRSPKVTLLDHGAEP